eukprot:scaffold12653_cov62-Alexandrium_tamarense.AAC.1
MKPTENSNGKGVVGFRNRVKRTAGLNGNKRVPPTSQLSVDAAAVEAEHAARTMNNGTSPDGSTWSAKGGTGVGPMTPPGVRGHADLRSPG